MKTRVLIVLLVAVALAPVVWLTVMYRHVPVPEAGIPLSLAEERAARVSNLRYDLKLRIPGQRTQPVTGRITASFDLSDDDKALAFDFAQPPEKVRAVTANGEAVTPTIGNGHIVIPTDALERGANTIAIDFEAGDEPLNRSDEYLYALFVPARASLALPVFDQPDMKARWKLALEIPDSWIAISNGAMTAPGEFAETQPISTYLFTFAAGKFSEESGMRNGRAYRMLHRETDAAKVARNREAIFDLHAHALAWLEDYTGISYPFGKFDFVLIPSFQFGGMEHPGSVFYSASSLLLDEAATQGQQLGRASLIAHETAHMWFGDLVTMKWFNDVWMKEVFANFMAAKIVNPSFPEVNHDLRFLYSHYPAAYDVDRTAGANPIRQDLANLNEAGSLYGAIIYQKAPIVMRQLEELIGADVMRDGLREYLRNHSYGNATWHDLIEILDRRTEHDLQHWSRMWVEQAGRPTVQSVRDARVFPPAFNLHYGDVVLNARELDYLATSLHEIKDPLERGSALILLWENMLEGRIESRRVLDQLLRSLEVETNELTVTRMLGYLGELFWRFTPAAERPASAQRIEAVLKAGLDRATSTSLKTAFFNALRNVATTRETTEWLWRVWAREEKVPGVPMSEADESELALELAVRGVAPAKIVDGQLARIQNPDRKARFQFVKPAVSPDAAVRAQFFETLKDVKNRRREAWVLEAARYLHHPVRNEASAPLVRPALELVHEIQRTGDIFFPKRWADATLSGYQTAEVAADVRAFIDALPRDYPPRLRWVLLASADPLFRAARLR